MLVEEEGGGGGGVGKWLRFQVYFHLSTEMHFILIQMKSLQNIILRLENFWGCI